MCELFAMSSLYPTTVTFSLNEFSKHGGFNGPHKDGWGVAYYEENDVRILKDEKSAATSPYLECVKSNQYKSKIVFSHIRRATQGKISYPNTQPFQRELVGRKHTFIHNGDLKGINYSPEINLGGFFPVGETDSEYAFCYLMKLLSGIWEYNHCPRIKQRYTLISCFAKIISNFGPANFIYSDGDLLFVHGHIRKQIGRKGFHPPGLFKLRRVRKDQRQFSEIQGLVFHDKSQKQEVVLVASVPLTNEDWIPLFEGELLVLKNGNYIDVSTI